MNGPIEVKMWSVEVIVVSTLDENEDGTHRPVLTIANKNNLGASFTLDVKDTSVGVPYLIARIEEIMRGGR